MSVRDFIQNFDFIEVFEQAKQTSFVHKELINRLKSYYDAVSFPVFASDFFQLCKYSLLEMDNDPILERTLEFITDFSLSFLNGESSMPPMLKKLFEFSLRYCRCEKTSARYRSCQILQLLLNKMPPEASIPDHLFKSLTSELLVRATDVKWSVRSQAVKALSRLQNPSNPNCLIAKKIEWMCAHDPFPDVRKNALGSLILSRVNFDNVVICCRDISDKVRRTAFNILISKEFLKPLKLPQRVLILKQGLNDRNNKVRQLAVNLLSVWYNRSNRNPIELLYRIDGVEEENCGITCLRNLFNSLLHPTNNNGVLKLMEKWIEEEKDKKTPSLNQTLNATSNTTTNTITANNPYFDCVKLSDGKSEFERMIRCWAMNNLNEKRILKASKNIPEHALFWTIACEYLMKKIDLADDPVLTNFPKSLTLNSTDKKIEDKKSKKKSKEGNQSDKENTDESDDQESEEEDQQVYSVTTFEDLLNLICPRPDDLQCYLAEIMRKYISFDLEEIQKNNDLFDEFQSYKTQLDYGSRLFASMDIVDQYTRSQLENLVSDWTLNDSVSYTDVLVKLYIRLYPNEAKRISQSVSKLDELLDEAVDKLEPLKTDAPVPCMDSTKIPLEEKSPAVNEELVEVEDSLMQGIEPQQDLTCISVLSESAQKEATEKARREFLSKRIQTLRYEIASLTVKETELIEEIDKYAAERIFDMAQSHQNQLVELKARKEKLVQELEINIEESSKLLSGQCMNKDESSRSVLSNAVSTALTDRAIANLMRPDLTTDFDKTVVNFENDEESMESKLSRIPLKITLKVTQILADILMRTEKIFVMPATLSQFVKFKIIPLLRLNDAAVRMNIIRILGVCAQLHLGTAKEYLPILYKAISDDTLICNVAIGTVADIYILHGFQKLFFSEFEIIKNFTRLEVEEYIVSLIGKSLISFQDNNKSNFYDVNFELEIPSDYYMDSKARESTGDDIFIPDPDLSNEIEKYCIKIQNLTLIINRLLAPFLKFINNQDKNLKKNSIFMLIKLLLNKRIISADLFSVLVILWFDPKSDEIDDLRVNISQFISIYAYSSVANQMIIAKALFITLESLLKCPAESSLNQIDISSVVDLFSRLTSSELRKKDNNQANIAANAASGDKTESVQRINASIATTIERKDSEFENQDISHLYDEKHLRNQIANPVHDSIALEISNKILETPHSASTKWLIRLFLKLKLSPKRIDHLKILYVKAKSIIKVVERCNNLFLSKWITNLEKMITSNNITISEVMQEYETSQQQTISSTPARDMKKDDENKRRDDTSSNSSDENQGLFSNVSLNMTTNDAFCKEQNNLHLLETSSRPSFYHRDEPPISRTVIKPEESKFANESCLNPEESLNIFNDVTFNASAINKTPARQRQTTKKRNTRSSSAESDFDLSDRSSGDEGSSNKQQCRKKTPDVASKLPRKSILSKPNEPKTPKNVKVRIERSSSKPNSPYKSQDLDKVSPAKRTRASVAKAEVRTTRQTRSNKK